MPSPTFEEFVRYRTEASYNAASPESGADWNIGGNGGGANGWLELPVMKEDELQPKSTIIIPMTKSGGRHRHVTTPIAGAFDSNLGNYNVPVFPTLTDRIWRAIFGSVNRTPTAGIAALASTAFASVATLDTQPVTDEILVFTIASSTAASAAAINIIQNGSTQETITIGTNAGTVNGVYYSKNAYNGGTNAITFTVAGTVTSGMVVISGIKYVTSVFTVGDVPSLVIEGGGRVEAGSGNSEYFPGCVLSTVALAYDRAALDGLLMINAGIMGRNPTTATAGTYVNEASNDYYRAYAAWTCSVTIGGAANAEVRTLTANINPNTGLYEVSSGDQNPSGIIQGEFEDVGTMTIIPADDTQWAAYRDQTIQDVNFTWTSPYFVNAATPYSIVLEIPQLSIGDYTRTQIAIGNAVAQGADVAFTGIYEAVHEGAARLTVVDRTPV